MTLRDLSHPLEPGMPVYPGADPVRVEAGYTFDDGGVRTTEFSLDSHNGTHVDAPSHMARDGMTLADFDVADFRFEALLVDCTGLDARDAIPADRIPERPPADVDLLVLNTGWSTHWGNDRYFDHPYLSTEAAERVVDTGCDVAIDVMSPDPTPSPNGDDPAPGDHPAHDILFGADRRIVENLRNLDGLPERFTLHAYPLPLGRDGAQVRAVAEY